MSQVRFSKNIFALLLLVFISIFFTLQIAAQCGGTYFKRSSTRLLPMDGFFYATDDMTGDGIPDLFGSMRNADQVLILPGNGNGGFGSLITITLPNNFRIYGLIITDFNGDGLKDIFFNFYSPSGLRQIYKNNGNGTFTPQTLEDSGTGVKQHVIDINNDGLGDLITTLNNTMRYHLGNSNGTFQDAVSFTSGNNVVPGDFNGDGKVDFIAGNNLILNQGGGTFSTVANAIALGTGEGVSDVRDYTGDGKPDIVTLTSSTAVKVSLLKNNGDNSFQRTDYTIAATQQNGNWNGNVKFGNFSGSGSPDILFAANSQSKTIVFTNDGAGNFSAQTFDYKFPSNDLVADFDNDGKTDVVTVSNSNFDTVTLRKFFNEATLTLQKNVCNPVGQTRLVDFDASGTTDYSFWTPADGKWDYLPSNNGNQFGASVNWGASSFGDVPTPGDFDGDGKTDHAVYRDSNGTWWIKRSSDNQPSAVQFGLPGDKPVVGDYDGDGVSDVAVWRPSDGNWYILFMGTQGYTIAHWGTDGDKPVPEDYDGDGKTDLAVFRPSTGEWFYLKSSDLNLGYVNFGLGSDRPVPADYDGDGKADIAVYRGSNNVLHLLRSYNYAYSSYIYGVSGDIPQPGDYDGDFNSDFGIYRPSNQWWKSFNTQTVVIFGGSGVVPTSSLLRIE